MSRHLVISDLHPGRWGKSEELNGAALQAFAICATNRGAELIVNGDFDEHLIYSRNDVLPQKIYARQRDTITRALATYSEKSNNRPVRFLQGNHDKPGLSKAGLIELMDPKGDFGLNIHPEIGLFHRPHNDVLITHGHLVDTGAIIRDFIQETLRHCEASKRYDLLLTHAPDLEKSFDIQYEQLDRWLRPGFMILSKIRKRLLQVIEGRTVPTLLAWKKQREQARHFSDRSIEGALRSQLETTMTQMAAELAQTLGASVCLIGHDHAEGIFPRWVENDGNIEQVLVGNSGHWIGEWVDKTALYVDTDERIVGLLKHDAKSDSVDFREKYLVY